ncbi:hypothetical protein DAEQUDRAFT_420243 [Daedalea quercina L-15889]|uniref:Uncharacterized protein n=1 Tax=Daedalea quercina L-15889 TaxID=1314783 RepID=A0A165TKW9_9APHY|nr:hypothetical protein DAEQUDRAFT_420243 [Daedalea quercina L-15889]
MAFTYAPDFVFKRKRRGLQDESGSCAADSLSPQPVSGTTRPEPDVPGWTVLSDDAPHTPVPILHGNNIPQIQTPQAKVADAPTQALTVEDFLRWSVRTPPAKRYGGRKHRRAKLKSQLLAFSEHSHGDDAPRLSDHARLNNQQKAPSSETARRQRAPKPKPLASCTFTAAALTHAPPTQIAAHTGGRVPLAFVDADEDAHPHSTRKKGKLVDPRKSAAFPLLPTIGECLEAPRPVRSARKPITRWMLRGADVKVAMRALVLSYGHTSASSPTTTDPDLTRCNVFPFTLVSLEEHEVALQTKYRCFVAHICAIWRYERTLTCCPVFLFLGIPSEKPPTL